ncbi:flagellar biosynthesis protein FlhF [Paenibacillus sp. JDR-2]|uniref:flagellar biosynthesis protein FlhF n=1 Tax=Paenibacillus sp. (strain JDR-2) TaxID=324057 RepID=UPI0001665779|nr:flagellar biosynthesis protein FlhF [Paenibacillus sp. JDR-2]ACT02068.1 GTP-binding signal recognition particle SRP54 G- domain protein [Paenibacillus sp. JDR-2]
MRVKRYVVNALPEALPMIRSELGKDAVILNTKEVRIGGFMGMFRKKKMEVIAAIESGAAAPVAATQPKKAAAEVQRVVHAIQESKRQAATATAVLEPPPPTPVPAVQPTPPVVAASPPSQTINRINDDLLEEIRYIKQSLKQLSMQKPEIDRPLAIQSLYGRLVQQEVEPELIDRLIDAVNERIAGNKEMPTGAETWQTARELLLEWLDPYSHQSISESARIVHFVGPTGVGKTTTIAKLAAGQSIKFGRQIGLITSDTYRIAAVDQLRTYANILNVPMEVVFSPMDLPKAFKQLEDRELIYMDTAGRNFRNELHVSEVNSLLQSSQQSETVLVLSLTGKTKDMMAVADNFVKYGVRKVLFTKLDETSVYGSILNLALKNELQPVFVASGQTVPDDIAPFNAERYIDSLLGAPADE